MGRRPVLVAAGCPNVGVDVSGRRPIRILCAAHLFHLPEMRQLRHAEQEHAYAIGLDSAGRVLVVHLAAVGTVDVVHPHTRDIFRELIRQNCTRFLYVHNHPGGDRRPSKGDREVTRWLTDAGKWLGIPLDAHLLVAGEGEPVTVRCPVTRRGRLAPAACPATAVV